MSSKRRFEQTTVYTTRTEKGLVTVKCDGETYQVKNGGHTGLNLVSILPLAQRDDLKNVDLSEEVDFTGTEIFLTSDTGSVSAQLPAGHYLMNPRKREELTDAQLDALNLDNLPTVEYGAYLFQVTD